MKKFLTVAMVCVALASVSLTADAAKRFGGGSSFGRSAPTFTQKAPVSSTSAYKQAPSQNATSSSRAQQPGRTAPAQKPSMLKSVLGGLAAALGISALLSLLGINGAGMVSFIMGLLLAGLLFVAFRAFMSSRQPQRARPTASAYEVPRQAPVEPQAQAYQAQEPVAQTASKGSVMDEFYGSGASQASGAVDITPEDFDKAGFLKVAADNYRKLQMAWATGNVLEISDFVSNDMFVAITHQLRERGHEAYNVTVDSLTNELLGIAQEDNTYVAVVKFKADITINGEKEHADELWLLEKPVDGNKGWILSGIRQNDAATN